MRTILKCCHPEVSWYPFVNAALKVLRIRGRRYICNIIAGTTDFVVPAIYSKGYGCLSYLLRSS